MDSGGKPQKNRVAPLRRLAPSHLQNFIPQRPFQQVYSVQNFHCFEPFQFFASLGSQRFAFILDQIRPVSELCAPKMAT